jgi:transcription initiation factor TFIID subunit 6
MEEHLSGIIRDALAIQRHAKRTRMHQHQPQTSTSNNNNTGVEYRPTFRRRLHAADINLALQLRGCERLYATNVVAAEKEDAFRKLDLEAYLRQESIVEPPTEIAAHRHWLAVDGMQPNIPENPTSTVNQPTAAVAAAAARATNAAAVAQQLPVDATGLEVHRLQAKMLSEELQLYYTRVHLALERGNATPETASQQEVVLQSLASDTGLQELVPFLVRYIQTEIHRRIANVEHCRTLVRAATAMLRNPHLHLELHMHELLPALFSCVVAKRLPGNHWALRRDAALALLTTCQVFGKDYVNLQVTILQPLCNALGPDKGLASRYGGMAAVTLFGPKAVDAYLLEVILLSWDDWEKALESPSRDKDIVEAIRMCQQAALTAMYVYMHHVDPAEKAKRVDWEDLSERFGDRLVSLQGEETDYSMCFV